MAVGAGLVVDLEGVWVEAGDDDVEGVFEGGVDQPQAFLVDMGSGLGRVRNGEKYSDLRYNDPAL